MKKQWCYEISERPCKDSDAGIGIYITLNDEFSGKFTLGVYFGKYLFEYSTKYGVILSRGFATGCGG